jgi:hypothetical protein
VDAALLGSFTSSYMFTFPARAGHRISPPPPHPVRPNPGWARSRAFGRLIPVGVNSSSKLQLAAPSFLLPFPLTSNSIGRGPKKDYIMCLRIGRPSLLFRQRVRAGFCTYSIIMSGITRYADSSDNFVINQKR